MKLTNKIAVVTGASSGLGKALVELLVKEQVKVFALARSIEKTKFPTAVIKIPLNIRDLQNIDQAFDLIDQKTKKIDILVNCAGRGLVKNFEDITREEIMDIFGINLKGNIYIAQEVYKRMILKKYGHIINVISTSGLKGREAETIYCASKWGLRGFTESLKLAAHAHNIRVSAVYPGGMKSENFWKIAPQQDISQYMDPILVAKEIVNLLKSDYSILPSELVIERN
ncbi:SDR family oxidoreductase [Candidatus Beckwithbacteria bacterium]|nr:SDR family oxidoreductase [Candidatus Beckwithbacteria bacterium]